MAESSPSKQYHFVLVHGASHGGWCWYKIRTLLQASGHKVTCLDLKCSGIDPTDFNTVFTFAEYNEPLTNFMSSLPSPQKVIVVGHSAGGVSITDVIHKFGEKIHLAVYVAAVMLKHGYSISKDEDIKEEPMPCCMSCWSWMPCRCRWTKRIRPSMTNNYMGNDDYEYIYGLGEDQPPTGVISKPERWRTTLYNRSPIQDYVLASLLLRPAPVRALNDVWFDGGAATESVPRVFVRTLHDQLMAKEKQDFMIKSWPPSQVFATQSDHSPFFSTPDELFHILIEATALIKCD